MRKRKKWSAAEKLRIVLAGMQPNVEVSEPCRREGINPTQYYGWTAVEQPRFSNVCCHAAKPSVTGGASGC
jgi:hypothetical protein